MDPCAKLIFSLCLVILVLKVSLVIGVEEEEVSSADTRKIQELLQEGSDVVKLIESHGYIVNKYDADTQDGYILTMFRIVNPLIGKSVSSNMKPLLLMHGLLGSPANWVASHLCKDFRLKQVVSGDDSLSEIDKECWSSLGFLLSDSQYDVWLGTVRGSVYGRKHVYLDVGSEEFWNFSYDEQISLDLTANIKCISRITKQPKIGYIGFEHGSRLMFGLLAEKPDYAKIIDPIIALAPLIHLNHVDTSKLENFRSLLNKLENTDEGALRNSDSIRFLKLLVCGEDVPQICDNLQYMLFGSNADKLNKARFDQYLEFLAEGTSAKVLAHYGQAIDSKRFAHFNYREAINKNVFGSPISPDYDLGKIRSKSLYLFYSSNDWLSTLQDLKYLEKDLHVAYFSIEIKTNTGWNQFDYLFNPERQFKVNEKILDVMSNYPPTGINSASTSEKRKIPEQPKISQLITSRGYQYEEYNVKTPDGYILNVLRIINPVVQMQNKYALKPVILMHGLLGSQLDWVINSEGVRPISSLFAVKASNSLALSLSNNYYDVWLGTMRGSFNGLKHKTLSANNPEFWDFSQDEHIMFDLPSIIDFVRHLTKKSKVGYVGISHGSLMAFGLISSKPQFGQILEPIVALAPIAFMSSINPTIMNDFLTMTPQLRSVQGNLLKNQMAMKYLKLLVCGSTNCDDLIYLLHGFKANELSSASKRVSKNSISTSIKTIVHYGQQIEGGKFSYFDYGSAENLVKYGQPDSPVYDLSNINARHIFLFHSNRDLFSTPMEVNLIKRSIKTGVREIDLSDQDWHQYDYLFSETKCLELNKKIINSILNYLNPNQQGGRIVPESDILTYRFS